MPTEADIQKTAHLTGRKGLVGYRLKRLGRDVRAAGGFHEDICLPVREIMRSNLRSDGKRHMALHRFRVTRVVYVFRHRRNALRHRFIGDDISVDAIAEVDGKIAVSFLGLGESSLSLTSPMMRYTSSGSHRNREVRGGCSR